VRLLRLLLSAGAISFTALGCADDAAPGFDDYARLKVGDRYTLLVPGASVVGTVEHHAVDGDRVSLSGAADAPGSRFMLKSHGNEVHGWLVLRDSNRAYTYDTVDGVLEITEVPVERIYPVCDLPRRPASERAQFRELLAAPSAAPPFIGSYMGEDLMRLQSRPGAPKVIYLDIRESMNGDTPIDFSKEEMWKGWASVAAGFSSFDVNVTTDSEVYEAAGVPNSGIAVFEPTDERAQCVLGAFGTREACEIFTGPGAEPEEGYGVGRTTLHELGHLMGLDHDGTGSEEYFNGFSEFDWAPIMGNYYAHAGNDALNQWSKGEYSGANNEEDDLEILSQSFEYLDDDIPGAQPLQISGTDVSADDNWGQIARTADSDDFTFTIGSSGHATLNVERIEYIGGSMLDVDARIVNANGEELAANNPKAARGARLDLDLPAGDYTLVVRGAAEGTPSNGFSNYSSIGFYGIRGTITGAVIGTGGTSGAGGMGGDGAGGTAGSSGNAGTSSAGTEGGGASGASGSSNGGSAGGGVSAGGAGLGGAPAAGGAGLAGGTTGGTAGSGVSAGGTGQGGAGAAGVGNAGAGGLSGTSGGGAAPTATGGGAGHTSASAPKAPEDGCGCRVAGASRDGQRLSALLVFGLAWLLRSRRRSKSVLAER
jgi:hypothetical protein